jgi:high affinity sulfate transporter 1
MNEVPGSQAKILSRIISYIPVVSWLPKYDRKWLRFDLLAGLTLAAFAIPDGMAYASLAGLPPQYGLYVSIVAPLLYFLFATSRQAVVGASSSEAILLASVLAVIALGDPYRYIMLASYTAILVGVIALVAWLLRLGFLVNLISGPVLKGFLVGTGLVIIMSQIPKILGIAGAPSDFFAKAVYILQNLELANLYSLAIGIAGLVILLILEKKVPRLPASLVLVVGAIIVTSFSSLPEKGVQIVGVVPSGLPCFAIPDVGIQDFSLVFPLALALFLLSYVELTSIARTYARTRNYEIDTDQELLALGASSIGTGFFQGFPIAGSFSKSAVNDRSGALTPLSGALAGLVAILVVLFFTGFLYYLPEPILAVLIIAAVINMVDFRGFLRIWSVNKYEVYIALITFAGVLVFGILGGVIIGVFLSLIGILYNISFPYIPVQGRIPGTALYGDVSRKPAKEETAGILVLRVDAPLIFANSHILLARIKNCMQQQVIPIRLVVIDLSPSPIIDVTAADMINDLYDDLSKQGITLRIANASGKVRDILRASRIQEKMGAVRLDSSVNDIIKAWKAEEQDLTYYSSGEL